MQHAAFLSVFAAVTISMQGCNFQSAQKCGPVCRNHTTTTATPTPLPPTQEQLGDFSRLASGLNKLTTEIVYQAGYPAHQELPLVNWDRITEFTQRNGIKLAKFIYTADKLYTAAAEHAAAMPGYPLVALAAFWRLTDIMKYCLHPMKTNETVNTRAMMMPTLAKIAVIAEQDPPTGSGAANEAYVKLIAAIPDVQIRMAIYSMYTTLALLMVVDEPGAQTAVARLTEFANWAESNGSDPNLEDGLIQLSLAIRDDLYATVWRQHKFDRVEHYKHVGGNPSLLPLSTE